MRFPAIQPSSPAPAQTRMGKRVNSASTIVAPKTISGIDKARPRRINSFDPFATAAIATILSSDITASATAMIRMADHSVLAGATSFSRLLREGEHDRDPQQENAARDLHERQAQQFNDKNGEDDAQGDRRAGAENDAQPPLPARQRAAGQRDYHGIVAREKNIDPDNLEKREPESRRGGVHGVEVGRIWREIKFGTVPQGPRG